MNFQQKLSIIQDKFLGEWLKTRQEVENELSDKNPMLCFCGRLATGLHERTCKRFQNKVTSETVKRLKHLLVIN